MSVTAVTIPRVTMPPGGPHFQPPYGPPPGYPAQGYGPPPVAPAYGPPAMGPRGPGSLAPPAGYAPPPSFPPATMGMPPGYGGPRPSPFQAAPGYPGPVVGGPPVVVDVGGTNARKAVIGATVAGAIGLFAIGAAALGAVDDGIGAILGRGAHRDAVPHLSDRVDRPQRQGLPAAAARLRAAGLRWDDPRGAPWRVPGSELSRRLDLQAQSPAGRAGVDLRQARRRHVGQDRRRAGPCAARLIPRRPRLRGSASGDGSPVGAAGRPERLPAAARQQRQVPSSPRSRPPWAVSRRTSIAGSTPRRDSWDSADRWQATDRDHVAVHGGLAGRVGDHERFALRQWYLARLLGAQNARAVQHDQHRERRRPAPRRRAAAPPGRTSPAGRTGPCTGAPSRPGATSSSSRSPPQPYRSTQSSAVS